MTVIGEDVINNYSEQKEKWISDAAYFKSLQRDLTQGLENQDWLDAEQEYKRLMKKQPKIGLVRIYNC